MVLTSRNYNVLKVQKKTELYKNITNFLQNICPALLWKLASTRTELLNLTKTEHYNSSKSEHSDTNKPEHYSNTKSELYIKGKTEH